MPTVARKSKKQLRIEAADALARAIHRADYDVFYGVRDYFSLITCAARFHCPTDELFSPKRVKSFDLPYFSTRQELENVILGFLDEKDSLVFLDKNRINKYSSILWNQAKQFCHAECKEHFFYAKSFSYVHLKGKACIVCAKPLKCVEGKNHEYVSLSPVQARSFGIYHGGNCYHVSRCKNCGDVQSVDSSG